MQSLKNMVEKYKLLQNKVENEKKSLINFMQDYLFLFDKSYYTDGYKFSYKNQDENWYVKITYYTYGLCNIFTGVIDRSKSAMLTGDIYILDETPDPEKIAKAFRIVLDERYDNLKVDLDRVKFAKKVLLDTACALLGIS